jgi:hypothetical protein
MVASWWAHATAATVHIVSSVKLRPALTGFAIGLLSHGLVIALGFLAGQLVQPKPGGLSDAAAVAVALIGTEILLGLSALIFATVMFFRRRRELGFGVVLGWLAGLVAILLFRPA